MDVKQAKKVERVFKGVANHWRVRILKLIDKNEGINLEKIAENLKGNMKTISEHTKKLQRAGLVNKKYSGRSVVHETSPYGKRVIKFIKSF